MFFDDQVGGWSATRNHFQRPFIAPNDALELERVSQRIDQPADDSIEPFGVSRDDGVVSVKVDGDPRQPVALTEYPAVGIGFLRAERFAKLPRRTHTLGNPTRARR